MRYLVGAPLSNYTVKVFVMYLGVCVDSVWPVSVVTNIGFRVSFCCFPFNALVIDMLYPLQLVLLLVLVLLPQPPAQQVSDMDNNNFMGVVNYY